MNLDNLQWLAGPENPLPTVEQPGFVSRRYPDEGHVVRQYFAVHDDRILGEVQEINRYGITIFQPYRGRGVGYPNAEGGIRNARFGHYLSLDAAQRSVVLFLQSLIGIDNTDEGYD